MGNGSSGQRQGFSGTDRNRPPQFLCDSHHDGVVTGPMDLPKKPTGVSLVPISDPLTKHRLDGATNNSKVRCNPGRYGGSFPTPLVTGLYAHAYDKRHLSNDEATSNYPGSPTLNDELLSTLAMMSHDVRGALLSIGAGLQLLGKGCYGQVDDAARKKLDDLHRRVMSVAGISEDFLGKAFAARDEFEMTIEALDIKADVVDPILEELSGDIQECNVRLKNSLDIPGSTFRFRASRVWMKSVFRNLLRNAIKYGGVDCRIEIRVEDEGSNYRISVYNSGKVICAQSREKLFSKFSRLDTSAEEPAKGFGLGLYMVRQIIRKHGGDIWYEPCEGGSNFIFTLPQD